MSFDPMSFEAWHEQQLDLEDDEFYREEYEETYKHRLILDTEEDAAAAADYLEAHGFTDVYYSLDDDSNNYDLSFSSDHKLTDAQEDEVLHNCPDCTYSFSIFAG